MAEPGNIPEGESVADLQAESELSNRERLQRGAEERMWQGYSPEERERIQREYLASL